MIEVYALDRFKGVMRRMPSFWDGLIESTRFEVAKGKRPRLIISFLNLGRVASLSVPCGPKGRVTLTAQRVRMDSRFVLSVEMFSDEIPEDLNEIRLTNAWRWLLLGEERYWPVKTADEKAKEVLK